MIKECPLTKPKGPEHQHHKRSSFGHWCLVILWSLVIRNWSFAAVILWSLVIGHWSFSAETSYPMLMSIAPVAVQVGRTSECEVTARYSLAGAYQVLVTGTGVTGEVASAAVKEKERRPGRRPQLNKIKVQFKVALDAPLGVRDVRIATPQGVSTLGQLVVVRDPVIRESKPNDTLQSAEAVTFPATICGAIERPEDVDFFKFHVAAGTALTFHVRCQRLQNKIHDLQEHADPILTLRNSSGSVLAANDNYFFGDPLLHYQFQKDGDYNLEIRDARYSGNPYWQYSIEVSDRPFVTNVYPSRVSPGVPTHLHLVGYNLPADMSAVLTLPSNAPEGLGWASVQCSDGQMIHPVPVIVSRLPEVLEHPGDNNTPERAQTITVPAGISGRIECPGDVDCYAFEAKAGERFTFEVAAREHQSALDSYLRILDDKGRVLAENDDSRDRFIHSDSLIENWSAPAKGRYVVEIRDLHLRGGPAFVYFLKVTHSLPFFRLETDTDKTLLAPGIASVIFARAVRKNGFDGEVQLSVEGLPPGVSANCGRILANGTDGCIILHTAPDAKQAAANIRILGSGSYREKSGKEVALSAVARPLQEIYMPGGGRYHYPAEMHTVSVGDPLDLKSVTISPTSVSIKPGESKKIDVTLERKEGFNQTVTLDVVYQHLGSIFGNSLPPGVKVDERASQTLLTGSNSKGSIVLKAAPDTKPVQNQQVPVMAHVSINFVVKMTYCAEPLLVTVPAK
jgi:hypothetical protein